MTQNDPIYDVAIIGAGPIGLELAVALKKADVSYIHFDAKQIGYTISWFAPQTRFFSSNERIAIAGVPLHTPEESKATREQYLLYLRSIVEQFDLKINSYEPVVDIQREGYGFVLKTSSRSGERRYRALRVVMATGGTDHPCLLNIPGEDLPHVSHYFEDPHKYFGQRVTIVGGRNSAAEAALRCHHIGAKVSVVYRQSDWPRQSIKYWLLPELDSLGKSGRIQMHFNFHATRITPTSLFAKQGEKKIEIPSDFVLLMTGYYQDNTLLIRAGVELEGENAAPKFDPETMQTNIPNLYVIGTATAGTQRKYRVFIENCHEHVDKIMRDMFKVESVATALLIDEPES